MLLWSIYWFETRESLKSTNIVILVFWVIILLSAFSSWFCGQNIRCSKSCTRLSSQSSHCHILRAHVVEYCYGWGDHLISKVGHPPNYHPNSKNFMIRYWPIWNVHRQQNKRENKKKRQTLTDYLPVSNQCFWVVVVVLVVVWVL